MKKRKLAHKSRQHKKSAQTVVLETLEQRLLYSADLLPQLIPHGADVAADVTAVTNDIRSSTDRLSADHSSHDSSSVDSSSVDNASDVPNAINREPIQQSANPQSNTQFDVVPLGLSDQNDLKQSSSNQNTTDQNTTDQNTTDQSSSTASPLKQISNEQDWSRQGGSLQATGYDSVPEPATNNFTASTGSQSVSQTAAEAIADIDTSSTPPRFAPNPLSATPHADTDSRSDTSPPGADDTVIRDRPVPPLHLPYDAVDLSFRMHDAPVLATDSTISFWFYNEAASGDGVLFTSRAADSDTVAVRVQNNEVVLTVGDTFPVSAFQNPAHALASDSWVHVAVTLDAVDTALFVNGHAYTETQNADVVYTNTRSDHFIDDARLYRTALTPDQIDSLYFADPTASAPTPAASPTLAASPTFSASALVSTDNQDLIPADSAATNTIELQAEALKAKEANSESPLLLNPVEPLEVIFVDSAVEDAETLIDGIHASSDRSRFVIVTLDSEVSGVQQISTALSKLQSIDAIHILSHGDGYGLQLGNETLDLELASNLSEELSQWGDNLDAEADLLIYGCNLASTQEGRDLVQLMAAMCECDVAASDDLTGPANLNADWELEYSAGEIDTAVILSDAAQPAWAHTLDVTTGLVGHYKFDSAGPMVDSTGNQDLTVASGNATGEPDAAVGDQSVGFDADAVANGVLEASDNAAQDFGTGDFTIAFWYQLSGNPPSDARILGDYAGSGEGFALRATTSGTLEVIFDGLTGSSSSVASGTFDGTWQHVTITYDSAGGTYQWYLNGTPSISRPFSGGDINTSNPLRIGALDGSNEDYDGLLDDVRLYTRQLSSSDVTELYGLGGDITTGLFAHYEFEENGGGTATDSTANNNDGSLTNAPGWRTDNAVGTYAMDFDSDTAGSQAFVSVPDDTSIDIDGDFAFSFWYNASTAPSGDETILGQYAIGDGLAPCRRTTLGGQLRDLR